MPSDVEWTVRLRFLPECTKGYVYDSTTSALHQLRQRVNVIKPANINALSVKRSLTRIRESVSRRSDTASNGPLRRSLEVDQQDNVVKLRFCLRRDVEPHVLWGRYQGEHWIRIATPTREDDPASSDEYGQGYRAEFDLAVACRAGAALFRDVAERNEDPNTNRTDVSEFEGASQPPLASESPHSGTVVSNGLADDFGGTLALFLEVERDVDGDSKLAKTAAAQDYASITAVPLTNEHNTDKRKYPRAEKKKLVRIRYRLPLGRFAETRLSTMSPIAATGGPQAVLYPNRDGTLSIAIDRKLNPYGEVRVRSLRIKDGVLILKGSLVTRHNDAVSANLLLKGRATGLRGQTPLVLRFNEQTTRKKYGFRHYDFIARWNLSGLISDEVSQDDTLDAWVEYIPCGSTEPFQVRVGRTRFLVQLFSRPGWARIGRSTVSVSPYYTYKAKKTSFHLEQFDSEVFSDLRSQMRRRWLPSALLRAKPIWLVGERPYKAQDNGLQFFKYLRKNRPEVDAYYVVEASSPEKKNLEGLGNVVDYRSKEHVNVALNADRLIGTHHPDFLYPLRTPSFIRAMSGTKVFLQHGVMGTKWLAPMYGKTVSAFETDLFIVSSAREKEYIVSDFGYSPDEVAVTGLARFDTLFQHDVPTKSHQILIIPTWREWLQDPKSFLVSDYFYRWKEFLTHPALKDLADKHHLDIIFCLHPNMQQHRAMFADVPARIISQGEVDVQFLLKQSALLITDYSSVAFDFSFLHKPVIYYQFDRSRFLGARGSHLDLDRELPGPIAFELERLMSTVTDYISAGNVMEPKYVARADNFIEHRDTSSSERIFEAIKAAKGSDTWIKRAGRSEVFKSFFRIFRRSKYYFPAMRLVFRLRKLLPADPNLIVFESGVGTQYADSPRYIYEELLRRGDNRTKVWAYPRSLPLSDENTIVVQRLSPRYYWYLAKAKYWVNNQSFPHYLTRRPQGVYVQTWHGTPIKRMAHDLDEVYGRDEGYLSRVTQAADQWSLLISPSPYATQAMRSAFRYRGEVLETGYPRNDVLFNETPDEAASRMRSRLGIGEDKTVILYAPTFRDNESKGKGRFSFKLPIDLGAFNRRFGDNTVLLLRTHVLVRDRITIPDELTSTVIDVSDIADIHELYLVSHALVTDYSSVFFDFANLKRPIVFYAYDLDMYRDQLRGFYLDYDTDLPGPVVTTQAELFDAIDDLSRVDNDHASSYREFTRRFSPLDDGRAAERVVDHVFGNQELD